MPSPNPLLKCANCLAFEAFHGEMRGGGNCHRHPTTISFGFDKPVLADYDWCMEFISKPEIAEQMRASVKTVIPAEGIEVKVQEISKF